MSRSINNFVVVPLIAAAVSMASCAGKSVEQRKYEACVEGINAGVRQMKAEIINSYRGEKNSPHPSDIIRKRYGGILGRACEDEYDAWMRNGKRKY